MSQFTRRHDPANRLIKISDSKMAGQWVCQATRSGYYDGVINMMYRRVRRGHGFGESIELEVLPTYDSKWLCHEGDAGSWVVKSERELVGMGEMVVVS